MKTSVALLLFLALCAPLLGKEFKNGDTVEIKANSIWFQDQAMLTKWQELKKNGDKKALKAYEEKTLGDRDAWQFTKPLKVKLIGYDPAKKQVHLEMTDAGRMQGTKWWVDTAAVVN